MKKKIDRLLQNWASARRKDEEELQPLIRRISTEAVRRRRKKEVSANSKSPRHCHRPLVFAAGWAVGTVLAALVAFGLYLYYRPSIPPAREKSELAETPPAAVSEEQIAARKKLFDELERLFSDQFRWFVEHNGRVAMGIEDLPGSTSTRSKPVNYRFHVVKRETGESNWDTVWSAQVVLRSEEVVRITTEHYRNDKFTLWVFPLPDGKVAVDADFSLSFPIEIASRISSLQHAGRPEEILTFREGEAEYRILQTVHVLEDFS